MPKAIWKFKLTPGQIHCPLRVPANHKWLSVGVQDGSIFLWGLVDPSQPMVDTRVWIVTTGVSIEEELGQLIGRADYKDALGGNYVMHVFADGVWVGGYD